MATIGQRPDPDALLKQVEADENETGRGRLKIFLGYASGVGKSLKMLDEGRRRRERGQDVIVGAIQPYVPDELGSILEKLPVVPLRFVNGIPVMDIQAILERKPAVCLVDGLAFDNPPGSRHAKRWQDVEELLQEGISVISSLNIQFIEELQPRVENITKKHVRESVPQKFISSADEIVVVDAPPEICSTRSIETGLDPKVVEKRLSELRELALLLAADVVDRQLEAYLHRNGLASMSGAQERILICLSPAFDATEMVASAKRNADRFHCDLLAVYVRHQRLGVEEEAQLSNNIRLAQIVGAQVQVLNEDDPIDAIIEYAHTKAVTQLFVGHSPHKKWWNRLSGSSLERLIRNADGLDVKIFPH
jgi:two-component system, OmpR family, sensor histidine kinase KdpD